MKTTLGAFILGSAFVLGGCATGNQGASYGATGETDEGSIYVKEGKRHEVMVGSRLARDKLENSEFVKTIGRRGYKDAMTEKSGAPLQGQTTGM